MLSPIKNITSKMISFSKGNLSSRIQVSSNDEIGTLANSFNTMAGSIQELIKTREVLLRDIGHELRTPIAKGKFAMEKIEDFSQKELLKRIFSDLEILTNDLIELEKLNSNTLNLSNFSVETLILETLNKLYIEDDSKVNVIIDNNFILEADLGYLSTAVKNIVDNAFKYTTTFPITIKAHNNEISIINQGDKLSNTLEHYLKPFVQEAPQRDGFGLGLSIVQKVIKKHHFTLSYAHLQGDNIFKVQCLSQSNTQ
jgi:two-component system OmpR family sensor kinase